MVIEEPIQPAQTTYSEPVQTIKLVQSVREMRCYTVTDSELKQLGLANIGIAVTFGLGSAFFAFGLDIYKDTVFSASIPPEARVLSELLQPACFWVGGFFWLASLMLYLWRVGMLRIIKRESGDRRRPFWNWFGLAKSPDIG